MFVPPPRESGICAIMHLANLTSFLDKVYLALFVSHHTDSFQPTLCPKRLTCWQSSALTACSMVSNQVALAIQSSQMRESSVLA